MSPITEKFRLPLHKANTNAIKLKVEYGKCSNTHVVLKIFKFGRVNGVDGKLKFLVVVHVQRKEFVWNVQYIAHVQTVCTVKCTCRVYGNI